MKTLVVHNDVAALVGHIADLSADKTRTTLVLFTGSKDKEGVSWCPDCVRAEPVLERVASDPSYASDHFVLITVYVGDRNTWKDQSNPFRTHKDLRVKCVPTLINLKNSQRLEESQLFDEELVRMLLEE